MKDRIDLGALSDRELLLLTAQMSNEMRSHLERLNSRVDSNAKRISKVEQSIVTIETKAHTTLTLSKKQTIGWGSLSLAVITTVVVILSKIIEVAW